MGTEGPSALEKLANIQPDSEGKRNLGKALLEVAERQGSVDADNFTAKCLRTVRTACSDAGIPLNDVLGEFGLREADHHIHVVSGDLTGVREKISSLFT